MKYRDFLTYVMPETPGAPAFQVDKAVRDTAIDFCSKVDIYRAEPETIQTIAGVNEYDISGPVGAEPNRVMALHDRGKPLVKVNDERDIYAMIDRHKPTRPTHFYQRDNAAIILAPTPNERIQLRLFMSLKPTATSTTIPDAWALEYRDLLSTGAKARLMMMNGQPWSNPNLGLVHKQEYDRGVSRAIRRVNMGFSGAPIRVKMRDFI